MRSRVRQLTLVWTQKNKNKKMVRLIGRQLLFNRPGSWGVMGTA